MTPGAFLANAKRMFLARVFQAAGITPAVV